MPVTDDVARLEQVGARFGLLVRQNRSELERQVRAGVKRYQELCERQRSENNRRADVARAALRALLAGGRTTERPDSERRQMSEYVSGWYPPGLVTRWHNAVAHRDRRRMQWLNAGRSRTTRRTVRDLSFRPLPRRSDGEFAAAALAALEKTTAASPPNAEGAILVEFSVSPEDYGTIPAPSSWGVGDFSVQPKRDRIAVAYARLGALHDAMYADPLFGEWPREAWERPEAGPWTSASVRSLLRYQDLEAIFPLEEKRKVPADRDRQLDPKVLSPALAESLLALVETHLEQLKVPAHQMPGATEAARHLEVAADRLGEAVSAIPLVFHAGSGNGLEYNTRSSPHSIDTGVPAGKLWNVTQAIDACIKELGICDREGRAAPEALVGRWINWDYHWAAESLHEFAGDLMQVAKTFEGWRAQFQTSGNYPDGAYYIRIRSDSLVRLEDFGSRFRALAQRLRPPLVVVKAGSGKAAKAKPRPKSEKLTDWQKKVCDAVLEKGTIAAAARALGRDRSSVSTTYARAKEKLARLNAGSRSVSPRYTLRDDDQEVDDE